MNQQVVVEPLPLPTFLQAARESLAEEDPRESACCGGPIKPWKRYSPEGELTKSTFMCGWRKKETDAVPSAA